MQVWAGSGARFGLVVMELREAGRPWEALGEALRQAEVLRPGKLGVKLGGLAHSCLWHWELSLAGRLWAPELPRLLAAARSPAPCTRSRHPGPQMPTASYPELARLTI